MTVDTVERRSNLSLEEFQREYAEKERPVIITDVTQDWKAADWTPEYLAEIAGDVTIETVPTQATSERGSVPMTLGDYVTYYQAPDERKLYMINWAFEKDKPELLDDFEVPIYFRDDWLQELPNRLHLLWIFLGPADSGLFLHQDVGHTSAWNVQLSGSKAWLLWSPDQEEYLYAGQLNAFEPDFQRFPKFQLAKALTATVQAGECLYVPPRWWHQTKNVDGGMALTANYVDALNANTVVDYLEKRPDYREVYLELKRVVRRKKRGRSQLSCKE